MDKINKLSIPVAIVLGCLILGGVFYMVQANKQKSIEKQQQAEVELKKEEDKQDYITKRRAECLQIYKTESDKWNNTQSFRYIEPVEKTNVFDFSDSDVCEITYKDPNKKSESECEKMFDGLAKIYEPNPVPPASMERYLKCLDGTFTKEF